MSQSRIHKIAEGSAKDLYEIEGQPEKILLKFSDRISVFDYGALPDQIPGRARSLEAFSKTLFSWLDDENIPHGFLAKDSTEREEGIVLRRATHPKFGRGEKTLQFLPLEVVFRWGVPEGSSYLKRNPEAQAGEKFKDAKIEFFTKLEAFDRLLEPTEASALCGSPDVLEALTHFAEKVAEALKKGFEKRKLFLWDGKIECAWDESKSEIILIDCITPDELRLESQLLPDLPLSKELLRLWLSQTSWAASIRKAKKKNSGDWKSSVTAPPRLGVWRQETLSRLYRVLAEAVRTETSQLETFYSSLPRPKVFVLGGGGREEAERWRLRLEGCDIVESESLADAVWVSMDADLEKGLADTYLKQGYWTWGPLKNAAQLEWSKEFGRDFAKKAGLKIPHYCTGKESLKKFPKSARPPVVKLDGLAAGKGVIVPNSWAECEKAVEDLSRQGKIILEEQLKGPECSAFFAVQSGYGGTEIKFLGTARDFKRRFPGDEGPNTGGMGSYTPHPDITPSDILFFSEWAKKVAIELEKQDLSYNGILYMGLLKDEQSGWNLIEFNARFGDPETQSLVVTWDEKQEVLRSLLGLSGRPLREVKIKKGQALCLALVRKEYPAKAPENFTLVPWKPDENSSCVLFQAKSWTGRVAYLVAFGKDIYEAGDQVFQTWVESPWKAQLDWRADILP